MKYIFFSLFFISNFTWGQTLGIFQAIDVGINRSVDLYPLQAEIDAQTADILAARLSLLPSLSLGYDRSEVNGLSNNRERYSLTGAWSQMSGLGEWANWMKQNALGEKVSFKRKGQILEVEQLVSIALFDWIKAKNLLEVQKSNFDLVKEAWRITNKMYQQGRVSGQELLRTKIEMQVAQAAWTDQNIALESILARLNNLLGQVEVTTQWPVKLSDFGGVDKESIDSLTDLRNHPRYRMQKSDLKGRRYQMSLARSEFAPQWSFSMTRNYYPQWGGDPYETTAQLSVRLPFFENWSDVANYKRTQFGLGESQSQLILIERDLTTRYQAVLKNFFQAIETARLREETFDLAKKMLKNGKRS